MGYGEANTAFRWGLGMMRTCFDKRYAAVLIALLTHALAEPQAVAIEFETTEQQSGSWFSIPTLHFQVSAPSDYLFGWRDDFEFSRAAADYSEYQFQLYSDSNQHLRVASTGTTDIGSKPIREDRGMQVFLKHELPLQRTASKLFGTKFNVGEAELTYGLRYQRHFDSFQFFALGAFITSFELQSDAYNSFYGPQIAFDWHRQQFGFDWKLTCKLMAGENLLDANQSFAHRLRLSPGAITRPFNEQHASNAKSIEDGIFSSLSEIRTSISYPLSKTIKFQAGYIGIYFSDLRRASDIQRFVLPNLGLSPDNATDLWSDQIYASVEWRR